jgi:hypothetical protein
MNVGTVIDPVRAAPAAEAPVAAIAQIAPLGTLAVMRVAVKVRCAEFGDVYFNHIITEKGYFILFVLFMA